MEITYDELIARWQSSEFKETLDARIEADTQARYSQRMFGVGTDEKSRTELYTMSPQQYKHLRSYQMVQLLDAYKSANSSRTPNLLSINSGTTDPHTIRRVIGDRPGYIMHNGTLALDHDTIQAVHYISTLIGDGFAYGESEWKKSIDRHSLEKIVDEMISIKSVLIEQTQMPYKDAQGSKIYRETNLVKRAIGKAQPEYKKDYLFISDDERAQSGYNVFGIKDFELTGQELLKRKTNRFSKISHALSSAVKSLLLGKDEKEEARLGNETIDIGGRE